MLSRPRTVRGLNPDEMQYVALGSPAHRFKALVVGKVDATMVTNLQAAKLEKFPEIINLLHVPKIVPEIPYEFGMAREDYVLAHPDILYRLTRAVTEANRWIAANRVGTVEVARKILPEETVEDLTERVRSCGPDHVGPQRGPGRGGVPTDGPAAP